MIETFSDSAKISVSDNGLGISEEDKLNIFKPFNRVTGNTGVEGLGIGLDTCKMIVEDLWSKLSVESILSEGTTFRFVVPYVVNDW